MPNVVAVAARFEHDRQQGGMSAVILDIVACYESNATPAVIRRGLDECLALDYVAYRTDVTIGRMLNG